MLRIQLKNAGKRFQYEWVFRNVDVTFGLGDKIAITGSNGSGKSTFLKCLAGQQPLSEGEIIYFHNNQAVPESEQFRQVAFSAPYLELPEEFTLREFLTFHFKFKQLAPGLTVKDRVTKEPWSVLFPGIDRANVRKVMHAAVLCGPDYKKMVLAELEREGKDPSAYEAGRCHHEAVPGAPLLRRSKKDHSVLYQFSRNRHLQFQL